MSRTLLCGKCHSKVKTAKNANWCVFGCNVKREEWMITVEATIVLFCAKCGLTSMHTFTRYLSFYGNEQKTDSELLKILLQKEGLLKEAKSAK